MQDLSGEITNNWRDFENTKKKKKEKKKEKKTSSTAKTPVLQHSWLESGSRDATHLDIVIFYPAGRAPVNLEKT
jgi:hypothetical protein